MADLEVKLLRFYDDEAVGEIEINGERYEYVPSPAAELRPDESARVLLGKVTGKNPECYWVRSYFDGRAECDCLDFRFRKAATWGDCKHTSGCKEYGLIREYEPEPEGVEPPF